MSKATPRTEREAAAAWRRKVLAVPGSHESHSYNSRSRNNLKQNQRKKADFSDVRGGSSTSAPVRPVPPVKRAKEGMESIAAAMKRIRGGQ
jgi:hypothetical protein